MAKIALEDWKEKVRDPKIECMSRDEMSALQSERLVKQVKNVYDHVEFYRKKMDDLGVEPGDIKGIEDIDKLPFTTKSFIVAYDGTIIAGVDLTQAKVTITDQKVTISLPAPQILSHEVDPNSLEVFDETTSIFNPITIEDYTGFQADQQGVMEEKAIQSGLLTQAKDQAETAIGGLITPLLQEGQSLEIAVADPE